MPRDLQNAAPSRSFEDLRPLLRDLYSQTSAAACDAALRRAGKVLGLPLTMLPADPADWDRRIAGIPWAGHFPDEKAFQDWRKRVGAILRRCAAAPAGPPAGNDPVAAAWTALAEHIETAEKTRLRNGRLRLPNLSSLSIANLRARLGHVHPRNIDAPEAEAALVSAPQGKGDSLRRSLRFLDGLIAAREAHPEIAALLPPNPVGPLARRRDRPLDWSAFPPDLLASRDAALDRAVRSASPRRGRRGPDPLAGARRNRREHRRPVRNPEQARKNHLRALSWLLRHSGAGEIARSATDLAELVTEAHAREAVEIYAERARASAHLKDPEETSGLATTLSCLATLARRGLGDEDLGEALDDLRFEPEADTPYVREMSASRERFVRMVDYDGDVARAIVGAPDRLLAEARWEMAGWKSLSTNRRIGALKTAMAAALWALQLARSLRTRNLRELTAGEEGELRAPRKAGDKPWVAISKTRVKNRRALEHRIPQRLWEPIRAWLDEARPLWIAIHADRGFVENGHLFPGAHGPVCAQTVCSVWNRAAGKVGVSGLTPHMMRHVTATLYLARNPGDYATVAAFLGDSAATVEKHYARCEGRAAVDLFAQVLEESFPDLRRHLRGIR